MPKEEKFIRFCPICASKDFGVYYDDKAREAANVEEYKCKRCKNIFVFPLELPAAQAKKIKEVPLTKKILKDTPEVAFYPVGKVEIGVYWKILGAIMSIFGIIHLILALLPVNCFTTNGETVCNSALLPPHYALLGLAVLAAGMYLLLESFALNHKKFHQTRIMKIGVVLALLIIMIFSWAASFTI